MRSRNPKKIMKHIEDSLERAVDTLFRDINTEVAKRTPVRTGRAQKGWRKSRVYDMGFSGTMVENRVPYIALLDQGRSPKAPAGYVNDTIERLTRRPKRL